MPDQQKTRAHSMRIYRVLQPIHACLERLSTKKAQVGYLNASLPSQALGVQSLKCRLCLKEALHAGNKKHLAKDGKTVHSTSCRGTRCVRTLIFCSTVLIHSFPNSLRLNTLSKTQPTSETCHGVIYHADAITWCAPPTSIRHDALLFNLYHGQ